jgi:hypothetical protein
VIRHFGFAQSCAELRPFAAKNYQTVEMTVKASPSRARYASNRRPLGQPLRARYTLHFNCIAADNKNQLWSKSMVHKSFETENCKVTVQLPGDRKIASQAERELLIEKFTRVVEKHSDILDREEILERLSPE